MPTYGYRCSRGHHWEVVQRITEGSLTQCPECGAPATRVFYPVGIVFKGQGFYKTDSRGSGGIASGAASDGGGDKDGKAGSDSAKTETKTDTKSEAKTESKSKAGSDGGGKSDTPSTPPPAKTEEKS
jgi:putative FmdB family regulatory protein